MPVGSVGKWLVLGTLVAALGAGGCKEDEGDDEGPSDTGTPTADSGGGQDSGPADSGAKEAGPADTGVDAAPPVMCGGKVCMTHQASPLVPAFAAGCAKSAMDAEVCGLIATAANAYPEAGFPMFIENNAPGVDSVSCGAFLESKIEMPGDAGADAGDSGYGNMQLDTKRSIPLSATMNLDVALIYPGCCTPLGFCSANTSKGTSVSSFGQMMSNGGFGCLDPKILLQAAPVQLQQVPCDPQTGMIMVPASDAGTDGGSDASASDASDDGGNS
jgi:hypothetical protein